MKRIKRLQKRVGETVRYVSHVRRLKHYRGRGIHSPFVYSVVRKVFMPHHTQSSGILYEELVNRGAGKRTARQIQNLHSYCNCADFRIVDMSGISDDGSAFIIFIDCPIEKFEAIVSAKKLEGKSFTFVVLNHNCANVKNAVEGMIERKEALSIDNRNYAVFFYNADLPRQHFKL